MNNHKKFIIVLWLWVILAPAILCGILWAVDIPNQHRIWQHTSAAYDQRYFQAGYIDKDDADSCFNADDGGADLFLYTRGDSATGTCGNWNEVILIDLTWDSLFMWGRNYISTSGATVTCDSAWLKPYVVSIGDPYSNKENITVYRLHTDIAFSAGHYPSWGNPKSGTNWANGTNFSRLDLVGEDSVNARVTADGFLSFNVTDMMNDFADSTSRRTGFAVIVNEGDGDSVGCFYCEDIDANPGMVKLDAWWSETGINVTTSDSQFVDLWDTYINNYDDGEGGAAADYAYGEATTVVLGNNSLDVTTGRGLVVLNPVKVDDSLGYNAGRIDSIHYYFNVSSKSTSNPTIGFRNLVRALYGVEWGTGAPYVTAPDWNHAVHATIAWGTAGCANTTSDIASSDFTTLTVTATGAWTLSIPQSIAQGWYDIYNVWTTYAGTGLVNGMRMKLATESYKCIIDSRQASSNKPTMMFYITWESGPPPQIMIIE